MLTILSNYTSLYTEILHNCANLPKKGLFWPNCIFSQTFYPSLQIFLHEYIRHIRDISQLWASYRRPQNLISSCCIHFIKLLIIPTPAILYSCHYYSSSSVNKVHKVKHDRRIQSQLEVGGLGAPLTSSISYSTLPFLGWNSIGHVDQIF